MNDDDFKKHFGAKLPITDSKLFPQRRIGYIGYKTPEDAAKAVKYFNRTFIRMSRIGVEIARPVSGGHLLVRHNILLTFGADTRHSTYKTSSSSEGPGEK